MTAAPIRPPSEPPHAPKLPMLHRAQGNRSAVTCHLKCADACAHPVLNTSDNPMFRDIASVALSRRQALGLAAAGAVTLVVGGTTAGAPAAQAAAPAQAQGRWWASGGGRSQLPFEAIEPVPRSVDAMTVPPGYTSHVIIRWGDPLFRGLGAFDPTIMTAAEQALRFGYNNDYLDIIRTGRRSALLVCNHEYTNRNIMFPTTVDAARAEEIKRILKAAHGMAVVELRRRRPGDPWEYRVDASKNRRVTADTPFVLTGPAAGSDLVKTSADPAGTTVLGTLGNCAGGTTPWGTVLSGEENFHSYFVGAGETAQERRYGISLATTSTGWETIDPRFNAGANSPYRNEPNRFGYIVEIDPTDPKSTPQKHTSLGRFRHEGANIHLSRDGRAVAYMGDDQQFDYLYKFVSTNRMRPGSSPWARRHNLTLLRDGDLYVARFSGDSRAAEITGDGSLPSDGAFDGSGTWIPLVKDGQSAVPGMSVEQVLVFTRLAADAVGATKMDRCEDVQPSPKTGKVYVACTNNTARGTGTLEAATEVNPRNGNKDGHVVEITEQRSDAAATTFAWNLLLVCGDPGEGTNPYFGGYPADKVSPISCPDNLAFDGDGNLWIATDGQPGAIDYADALHKVPLAGGERGHVQQFLAVPVQAETCGPVLHDDEDTVYVAVQHPGENGTFEAQTSRWPDAVEASRPAAGDFAGPRPSIVQVYRS